MGTARYICVHRCVLRHRDPLNLLQKFFVLLYRAPLSMTWLQPRVKCPSSWFARFMTQSWSTWSSRLNSAASTVLTTLVSTQQVSSVNQAEQGFSLVQRTRTCLNRTNQTPWNIYWLRWATIWNILRVSTRKHYRRLTMYHYMTHHMQFYIRDLQTAFYAKMLFWKSLAKSIFSHLCFKALWVK